MGKGSRNGREVPKPDDKSSFAQEGAMEAIGEVDVESEFDFGKALEILNSKSQKDTGGVKIREPRAPVAAPDREATGPTVGGKGKGKAKAVESSGAPLGHPHVTGDQPVLIKKHNNGMVHASCVLLDLSMAAQLDESGYLESFPCVDANKVLDVGPVYLSDEAGHLLISPYYQFVFRVIQSSFTKLSPVEWPESALQIVQESYYGADSAEHETLAPDLTAALDTLASMDLTHISVEVGRLIFSSDGTPTVIKRTAEFKRSIQGQLTALRAVSPGVATWLAVLTLFWAEGEDVLALVSQHAYANPPLELYLNTVCIGPGTFEGVVMTVPDSAGELLGSQHTPRDTSLSAAQKPVVLAKPEKEQQVLTIRGQIDDGRPSMAPSKQQVSRERLLSQGDPGRIQIIRDTTTMAGVVTSDGLVMSKLVEMSTTISQNHLQVMQTLAAITKQLQTTDNNITALAARLSQVELISRQNVNRALLTTSSPVAQEIISAAPPLIAIPIVKDITLADRVVNADDDELPELARDLKSYFEGIGQVNFAASISVTILRSRAGKRGILNRLNQN